MKWDKHNEKDGVYCEIEGKKCENLKLFFLAKTNSFNYLINTI